MLTGVVDQGRQEGLEGPDEGQARLREGRQGQIRDGTFANMEGEVKEITEPKDATETPKVTVEVTIFGRPVEVELDYWQVDKV